MLAGMFLYHKKVEDSCPFEGRGSWLPLIPFTSEYAQAEALGSAQDVTQTFDFNQNLTLGSVQCPVKWEPSKGSLPRSTEEEARTCSLPSVLAADSISDDCNENLLNPHPQWAWEPGVSAWLWLA